MSNYANSIGGTGRGVDQTTRRVAALISTGASEQGLKTQSVTAWFRNDGSHTGNLQCHVYDHSGNQLTQIGSNVDVSTLPAGFTEYTFSANATQSTNSQFAAGQNGYVGFSISGTGVCTIEVYSTTTPITDYSPKKSTSTSNPYSFVDWDAVDLYYYKGTWNFGAPVVTGGTRLPPPPYVVHF